ncbi:MAG TPA: iron ABC transporter permease [Bdellovibrionota bacterium]|nr:iron ABC transporter permease [Bdellovibrionota bacterium]
MARSLLRLIAYLPGLLLVAPLGFLLIQSLGSSAELIAHVSSTQMQDALVTTSEMLVGVTLLCLVLGGASAWLLSRYEFWGASFWRWSLLLSLALPAYVQSFLWISWLDYSGLVPTWLRDHTGATWTGVFSNYRSLPGLLVPVALAQFPYMYLLIFEGLETQSRNLSDAARSLGLGRWRRFYKLDLPILVPWIASGVLLVGMETLADFGSVSVFNLNVFTTVVYRAWFGLQSIETASFFAMIHVLFLSLFVGVVLWFARRKKYTDPYAGRLKMERRRLNKTPSLAANLFIGVLWLISFVLPVLQLIYWSFSRPETFLDPRLLERATNSLLVAGLAAFIAVLFAAFLVFAHRFLKSADIAWAEKISSLGYGIPGTVIAVGWMAAVTRLWGASLQSTALVALVTMLIGLATRFLALAQRPVMSAASRISTSIEESSQSTGASLWRTLWHIHVPLLKNAFLIGFLFVFIDTLKEMPMTLLMRPYGWDTLAVRVYQYTSDFMWREAAAPSLMIVVASIVPIFLLRRRIQ